MGYKDTEIVRLLSGVDGNAFSVMGRTMELASQYIRDHKIKTDMTIFRDEFHKQAMSGDYNHLLRTCTEWLRDIELKCDLIALTK